MKVSSPWVGKGRGSAGDMTQSNWKGIQYAKTKATVVANPNTVNQRMQRNQFKAAVAIARMVLPYLQVTLKSAAIKMSAFNAFIKLNVNSAFTDDTEASAPIPANFIFAQGTYPGSVSAPIKTAGSGRVLNLEWSAEVPSGGRTDDMVLGFAITAEGNAYHIATGATRNDESTSYTVPGSDNLSTIKYYLYFQHPTNEKVSNSVLCA